MKEVEDELFCVKIKGERLMRSEKARKHREEIREIKEKHSRKEIEDMQHLVEKHETMIKNKKKS